MVAEQDSLVRGIIHEIKNPISLIRANIDLLESKGYDEEKTTFNIIKKELEYLDNLAFDSVSLLALNSVEEVYISDILDDLFFEYGNSYDDINFRFFGMSDTTIMGSEKLITMLFRNILKNSIEAVTEKLEQEQYSPNISCYIKNENNFITVHIKDNGIGMKKEGTKKGNGIGLKFCETIAKKHDAELYMLNNDEGGVTSIIKFKNN